MMFQDIRSIRTVPDPVLRAQATPVTQFGDQKMFSLVHRMIDVMGKLNGVGIAAPQIGVSQRLFGFIYQDDVMMVANGQIQSVSEDIQYGMEGCLSCPGEEVLVPRHLSLSISGQSIEGEHFIYEWSGLPARIIQHEMDHLNGKLILDYKT